MTALQFWFGVGLVLGILLGVGITWLTLLTIELCAKDPEEVAARSLAAIKARIEAERAKEENECVIS